MKYTTTILTTILTGVCSWASSVAQEPVTPNTLTAKEITTLWHPGDNPAGALLDHPLTYSYIRAGYDYTGGNLHRSMEADKAQTLSFDAMGATMLRDTYLRGYFSYDHSVAKEVPYNASILDPYRGMPYFVVDNNVANWLYERYNLGFGIAPASPVSWLSYGLAIDYKAEMGARQRDIRANNRLMQLSIKPGVVFHLHNAHHLGWDIAYDVQKEESRLSNHNTYVDQEYFELKGIGVAKKNIGSGRTTNYIGHTWSTGLRYAYYGPLDLSLSGRYACGVEDATISFDTPRPEGTTLTHTVAGELLLVARKGALTYRGELFGSHQKSNGIEYIVQSDQSEQSRGFLTLAQFARSQYHATTLGASLSLLSKGDRPDTYDWLLTGSAALHDLKSEYLGTATHDTARLLQLGLEGKYQVLRTPGAAARQLTLSLGAGYRHPLSGEYRYAGGFPEQKVHENITSADHTYRTTGMVDLTAGIDYAQKLGHRLPGLISVSLEGRYAHARKGLGQRHGVALRVSYYM